MNFRCSYYPNYFSLQDISATQETLPCSFDKPVRRLGFLDPTSDKADIDVGTQMDLPYWLAVTLSLQRQPIVTVDVPKVYKEAYREIMKADSCVVNLTKLGLYYYEFGCYLTKLNLRDSAAITSLLIQTFKDRFRQVFDWAQNAKMDPSLSQRLDSLEKHLFFSGQKASALMDSWLNEGVGQITASDMVVHHKKRRLAMSIL